MVGSLVTATESVAIAPVTEDGKEYQGGFGNIRIMLRFQDDKVVAGRYEILGEDKSGARFAQIALNLAQGQDIDDIADISPQQILAASGESGLEAKRYAKYASGALGFVVTRVHRKLYDEMLEEVERLADVEMPGSNIPPAFRGLGACSGCANLKTGGGCANPADCRS